MEPYEAGVGGSFPAATHRPLTSQGVVVVNLTEQVGLAYVV